jgi:phosphoribosylglycinamide formyltransferase-1
MATPIRIAIFISGGGTNADAIMHYFKGNPAIEVALVLSNKADAGGLKLAAQHKVPTEVVSKEQFSNLDYLLPLLHSYQIDWIVLAGFLWLIPEFLVLAYEHKIVNIHPALLPKFGGKGMYGKRVHEAVVAAKEKESGITIHYVDSRYDEGKIIYQAKCMINDHDTPETVAHKVQLLEHRWYPQIVEKVLLQNAKK